MDGTPTVSWERKGSVLVVRIERESRRNAIDRETAMGLEAAFDLLDDDPELWAGVLTGTPTVFSAGTDIRERADLRMPRGGEYGLIRRVRSKPLIAAVEGYALGGGFELALACDLIVASAAARFGLPEVRRGLVASSGALFRAPRALPVNVARELLITGRMLDAQRAYHLGVVNAVTEPGAALREALVMADEICDASPVAVRESLRAVQALGAAADVQGWAVTEGRWGFSEEATMTQRRGKAIAMSGEEVAEFLANERTCRVATTAPDGHPHVAPLWFVWDGESLWLNSIVRSRRWSDLRRDPRVAVVIDAGEQFHELRGVEISGVAEMVGEVPRTATPDSRVAAAELLFARKYMGGDHFTADGRHAWLRIAADEVVSWDFRKNAALQQWSR